VPKYHFMIYSGDESKDPLFLNSTNVESSGQLQTSTALPPGKPNSRNHWIGYWTTFSALT